MNDYYSETIWQYVEYSKYLNRYSTRLDGQSRQNWGNVISFKAKTKCEFPVTNLKRSRRKIQRPGSHSHSAKREIRIASNDAVRAFPLRMWVSYCFWILSVRTTIGRRNWLKSTFRKPEKREQNCSSLLIARLWARYSQPNNVKLHVRYTKLIFSKLSN